MKSLKILSLLPYLIIILVAKLGKMEFVSNAHNAITSIRMVFVAKLSLNAKHLMSQKASVKAAIKDGKSLTESVFKKTLLTQIRKDVKHGKMENVFNAQKDGTLMLMEFVKKFLIYAIHGLKMENARPAIKAML